MKCETTRDDVWDLLDGTLQPARIHSFLRHLRDCPDCGRDLDRSLDVEGALRRPVPAGADPDLPDRIMASLPAAPRPVIRFPDYARVAAALIVSLSAIAFLLFSPAPPVGEIRDAIQTQIGSAAEGIGDSVRSALGLFWRIM